MTSDAMNTICSGLLAKKWQPYANHAHAPVDGGIYCIGEESAGSGVQVIYVGRSQNIHQRLQSHKFGKQDIDEHIKKMFDAKKGSRLKTKWILDPDNKCNEGRYLECIQEKLGYWPEFNMRGGNSCVPCN